MSDYLPSELVRDILARLPIRTLLQCTIVCKSWYSLITSPSFISSHLKLLVSNNQNRVLVRFCTENTRIDSQSGEYENPETEHYYVHRDNQNFDEIEKLECPFDTWNDHFNIIASFNGLYCFSDDGGSYAERLILWNPSIRKSLTLPNPRVIHDSYGPYKHAIGFGFLPETNEYKIVRAVHLDGYPGWKIPPEVEIYDLSTGSWRDVDAGDCSYGIDERASQGFLNNSVHWAAYDPNSGKYDRLIVSFNLKTEIFGALMVPNILRDGSRFSVSTFRDTLCLIQSASHWGPPSDNFCCIWVMKEYGVENSWVKQFSIDAKQFDSFFKPIFYRENGDILLAEKSKLVSYDPKSKKVTNLLRWEETRSLYVSTYADTYMDSLVLIKASNNVLSRVVAELESQAAEGSEIEEKFSQMTCSSNYISSY